MNFNTKTENDEDQRCIWVIKDSEGNFAHKSSIGKDDTWKYIASKTFSMESRGYTTESGAEEALLKLNKRRVMAGFEFVFHIEQQDLNKIVREGKLFQGDNLVVYEREFGKTRLSEAI